MRWIWKAGTHRRAPFLAIDARRDGFVAGTGKPEYAIMTRRDMAWRIAGVALLATSVGSSLLPRQVSQAIAAQPAMAFEMLLGLVSFVLVTLGALFLWQGVKLRDSWVRDIERRHREREAPDGQAHRQSQDPLRCSEDHQPLAALLSHRTTRPQQAPEPHD